MDKELNNFAIKFVAESDPQLAEMLKNAAREFSLEEAMWLIHIADRPIEEKHEKYKSMIDFYPDHVLEWKDKNVNKGETLGHFLQEAIKTENELIAECMRDGDDAFYEVNCGKVASYGKYAWAFRTTEDNLPTFHTYQEAMEWIDGFHDPDSYDPAYENLKCKITKRYISGDVDNVKAVSLIYSDDDKAVTSAEVRAYKHVDAFSQLKTALPELQ